MVVEASAPNVLLVDDDPGLLRMARLALLSDGLGVTTATDGLLALQRLDDDAFDVIVLDLQMPNMDGRRFYRELRSRGHDTPVVILSAYGAASARDELGAERAIGKPFDPDVLIRTVRELAEQRKTRAQ